MESKLARLESSIEELRKGLEAAGRSIQIMWRNQQELSKSETLLDEQFAISTRMLVVWVNKLLEKTEADEWITSDTIQQLFQDWAKFKGHKDFRDFMMEWFLGVDLPSIPFKVETTGQVKEGVENGQDQSGHPIVAEGAPEDPGVGKEDGVPQVPSEDVTQG